MVRLVTESTARSDLDRAYEAEKADHASRRQPSSDSLAEDDPLLFDLRKSMERVARESQQFEE